MRSSIPGRVALFLVLCLALLSAQAHRDEDDRRFRLPDGKDQREAIAKADYKESLEDAAELYKLAEELKIELEKNSQHVVSVSSIRKTEQIEKLAKKIRSRMKRF